MRTGNHPHSQHKRDGHDHATHPRARKSRSRNPLGKLIFTAVFLFIALMIAKEEIPEVQSWLDQMIDPDAWNAAEQCRQQALQASVHSDFTRIIEPGEAKPTQNGYYIEHIVAGEMGDAGNEQEYQFSCYVSSKGNVVKSKRTNKQ